MKLWFLKPVLRPDADDNPWWFPEGCAHGFVIRAPNEKTAREMANKNSGCENYSFDNAWLDSYYSTCEELLSDGQQGIIIRDFEE